MFESMYGVHSLMYPDHHVSESTYIRTVLVLSQLSPTEFINKGSLDKQHIANALE